MKNTHIKLPLFRAYQDITPCKGFSFFSFYSCVCFCPFRFVPAAFLSINAYFEFRRGQIYHRQQIFISVRYHSYWCIWAIGITLKLLLLIRVFAFSFAIFWPYKDLLFSFWKIPFSQLFQIVEDFQNRELPGFSYVLSVCFLRFRQFIYFLQQCFTVLIYRYILTVHIRYIYSIFIFSWLQLSHTLHYPTVSTQYFPEDLE